MLATWSADYIDGLTRSRYGGAPDGEAAIDGTNAWISLFAGACQRAVADAEAYEERVRVLRAEWRRRLGQVRKNSATELAAARTPGGAAHHGSECRSARRAKRPGAQRGDPAARGRRRLEAGHRGRAKPRLRGAGAHRHLHGAGAPAGEPRLGYVDVSARSTAEARASGGSCEHQPEVPAPPEIIEAAVSQVAVYCDDRSTDDYRVEHAVRGSSVTILERRPPWNPDYGSDWSSLKVAQLRYDDAARRWRLFTSGGDGRWHPYELASPAPDVAPLLVAIKEDRTGIFWG